MLLMPVLPGWRAHAHNARDGKEGKQPPDTRSLREQLSLPGLPRREAVPTCREAARSGTHQRAERQRRQGSRHTDK